MIKLTIEGMTCGHCRAAVEKALAAVPGVEQVLDVSLETHSAIIKGSASTQALIAAMDEAGYPAHQDS